MIIRCHSPFLHGLIVDGHEVLWEHVQAFYDKGSASVHLAPRLTKKHIELPPFASLCVKLATQVLSHSVTAGMAAMAQWKFISGNGIQIILIFIINM